MRASKNSLSQDVAGKVISEVFAALREHGIELDLPAMTAVITRVNGYLNGQEPGVSDRRPAKPASQ